jgi:16S rRNA (adenine1518-N6/adenine1519-N6)-dimethyltransferase
MVEKLLKHRDGIHDMTLMLQSEVADRIASGPGGRQYGYLSVLVQLYCHVEKLFEVSPLAFRPPPRVRSAVVRLAPREREPVEIQDREKFLAVVRAAFSKRRKTILNSMKASGIATQAQIERALELAGVAPRRRAEELSLDEFAQLANSFIMRPQARDYER